MGEDTREGWPGGELFSAGRAHLIHRGRDSGRGLSLSTRWELAWPGKESSRAEGLREHFGSDSSFKFAQFPFVFLHYFHETWSFPYLHLEAEEPCTFPHPDEWESSFDLLPDPLLMRSRLPDYPVASGYYPLQVELACPAVCLSSAAHTWRGLGSWLISRSGFLGG